MRRLPVLIACVVVLVGLAALGRLPVALAQDPTPGPAVVGTPDTAEEGLRITFSLRDEGGEDVGQATVAEIEGVVYIVLRNLALPAGEYAVHLLETGSCDLLGEDLSAMTATPVPGIASVGTFVIADPAAATPGATPEAGATPAAEAIEMAMVSDEPIALLDLADADGTAVLLVPVAGEVVACGVISSVEGTPAAGTPVSD